MAKSYLIDETGIADAVERTKRQRRSECEESQQKNQGDTETAKSREGCRRLAQPCRNYSHKDQTTDLPRPAQPPRRCDDRGTASGDRLAATQCARLPGSSRQKKLGLTLLSEKPDAGPRRYRISDTV